MTAGGAATKMAPNFPMTPMRKRIAAHMYPDDLEAFRVRAMTPEFCEKVVNGGTVANPAKVAVIESASMPPWTLDMKDSPSMGSLDTSAEAVTFPMVSATMIVQAAIMGRTSCPRIASGHVLSQMKLPAGALWMAELLKYPVAAAMIRPMTRPMKTDADFMNADPKISQMMMTIKQEKPRLASE